MQFCSLLESNKAINFVSFETFRLRLENVTSQEKEPRKVQYRQIS